MHKITVLVLLGSVLFATSCNRKSSNSQATGFTGDVRIVTPFTQPSVQTGRLYMSKGRLRVDLGPMSDIYIVDQKKGWKLFPSLRQYSNIGEKQVSTYLPHLTNGSPCPNSELPSGCKMIGKESIGGRAATKWQLTNHHGEYVYLWTDDKHEIAVRWEIENVTYQLNNIRETNVPDDMFELPNGYTHNAAFEGKF